MSGLISMRLAFALGISLMIRRVSWGTFVGTPFDVLAACDQGLVSLVSTGVQFGHST